MNKEDFEALLTGKKDVTSYMQMNPAEGVTTCFGVRTASNPNYLVRALYEMYEANLDRKLANKAMRKLFRSVGHGSVGLDKLLKNSV